MAGGEQRESLPGVIIREALRGGPAEQAGLVDGDILTSIDGAPLDSATALTTCWTGTTPAMSST